MKKTNILRAAASGIAIATLAGQALAVNISWTDWTADISATTPEPGFTGVGEIVTATSTVGVTYQNDNGVGFFQTGVGIDYFQNGGGGRDASDSPYTSGFVDNIPPAAEMIALQFMGLQTLFFSEAIANPVFSYVSLNGNGYAFDQDFDILSFGHASDGNDPGYWGSGTSYKEVVEVLPGVFEYRLLGTGEPHGTIRFKGAFDAVSWRSLSNEYWNGFTVGVEGTEREIFPEGVPDSGSTAMLALSALALIAAARRFRS